MSKNHGNKDEEVNLTLRSLEGIKAVKSNPFLYEKTLNRMNSRPEMQTYAKLKYALFIAIFLILNAVTFVNFAGTETAVSANLDEELQSFTEEYNLTNTNYNY